MSNYVDYDYDNLPVVDMNADIHWVWLPAAVVNERDRIAREAREDARLKSLPPDHKIILVPSEPDYGPLEEELWPLINHAVQEVLETEPEVRQKALLAIRKIIAEHRGWKNPFHRATRNLPRGRPLKK